MAGDVHDAGDNGGRIIIPFTRFGSCIGLKPLPLSYFPWLAATLIAYCVLTQVVKEWYIRRFKRWL